MLLTYQECLDKYGSDYQIKKEIGSGALFMKEKGIYSTKRNVSEIDVIMHKYPKTVCTGKSAFYYHSLTDMIPDYYHLATRRTDTRIKDSRVIQSFLKDGNNNEPVSVLFLKCIDFIRRFSDRSYNRIPRLKISQHKIVSKRIRPSCSGNHYNICHNTYPPMPQYILSLYLNLIPMILTISVIRIFCQWS